MLRLDRMGEVSPKGQLCVRVTDDVRECLIRGWCLEIAKGHRAALFMVNVQVIPGKVLLQAQVHVFSIR